MFYRLVCYGCEHLPSFNYLLIEVNLVDITNGNIAQTNMNNMLLFVDADELGGERDKFRLVASELDSTFTELAGF
jgi:hypothetical protein